jgi:predicted phosphoadenosine phosphosulfate sulfurtransferase
MSKLKIYNKDKNVYNAAVERINFAFDEFETLYVSFSGGKDSTVMLHMVCDEAIKRNKKVGCLIIDLEAQYIETINSIEEIITMYESVLDVFWVCLPLKLRNAVSTFEPTWKCWDEKEKKIWVRQYPENKNTITMENNTFDFFQDGMEFEEFIVLFAEWYGKGKLTCGFIGIRSDESLNRFRTIASEKKEKYKNKRFTSKVINNCYNIYPIYDWKTEDIWKYHNINKNKPYNKVYDLMYKAGLSIHEMRLCQPYGDDQRKGIWLYHVLEPQTWPKVVNRVSGVNSGALYINEKGNINGYNKITKPENHSWESYSKLLLATMPNKTKIHFQEKFIVFLKWWKDRGYTKGIPDEAPEVLEKLKLVPSWKRICKVILRNDWWCKGLGQTQPKSEAYGRFMDMKKKSKLTKVA